jgi:protein-tyrosine-phosphatase
MTKKILFVCVENAGRSQMAEAFFKKYASKKFLAQSAGTKPTLNVNPRVIQAMNEIGIDLACNKPKIITDEMIKACSTVVNMGCMDKESCPALFIDTALNWNISDPKGKSIEEIRKIRDEIELKIKELVSNLQAES